MLPTAGLFLPETLHRRDRTTVDEAEKSSARPHFFQRTSLRPDGEAREARSSTTSFSDMRRSLEDVTDSTSSKAAFQFADLVLRSGKASSESRDLALLINRVRQDDAEASRLYLCPTVINFLEAWPDKRAWIDTIRLDLQRALSDIGEYVADTKDGESFGKWKMEWVSRQHRKITIKQQLLSTCHHSLITAISIMQTVELCGANNGAWQDPIYEAPVNPWVKPDDTEVLRGPYSRRETRMSQKNLSFSSMYLPQTEQESTDTRSVNSMPVELPGSTLEDVAMSRESISSISRRSLNSYRHPSARRAHFRNSTNDLREHMPITTALSEDSSPVAELEHTQLQAPAYSDATRRSFDGPLPQDLNTQAQVYQAYHPSIRRSSDFNQALPTLNEKTIERNDSTMSTTAVVAVPQVAKRYQPNPVYIRKSRDRHQSLPSALPHVDNHMSLTDELADYMTHLSPHSEQIPSVEWGTSSSMASPSISVVSCPAVAQMSGQTREDEHRLEVEERSGAGSRRDNNASIPSPMSSVSTLAFIQDADTKSQLPSSTPHIEPVQESSIPRERAPSIRSIASIIAPSIRSVSSVVSRKPLPETATISFSPHTAATIRPSPSGTTTPAIESLSGTATEIPEVSNTAPEIDDAPEPTGISSQTDSRASSPSTSPLLTLHNADAPQAIIDPPPTSSEQSISFPTLHDDDVPLRLLRQRLHDDHVPLGLLQQKLLHQTYVPGFAELAAASDPATSAPPATMDVSSTPHVPPAISSPAPEVKNTRAPSVPSASPSSPQSPPVPPKPAALRLALNALAPSPTLPDLSHPLPIVEKLAHIMTTPPPPAALDPAITQAASIVERHTRVLDTSTDPPTTILIPDPEMSPHPSSPPPIPEKPQELRAGASPSSPTGVVVGVEGGINQPPTEVVVEQRKTTLPPPLQPVVVEQATNLPTLPASLVIGRAKDGKESASAMSEEVEAPAPAPAQVQEPAKPMSAQAKRRAAHQRRMELAFGSN